MVFPEPGGPKSSVILQKKQSNETKKKKKNFEKEAWERVGLDSFLHMKLIVSTVISLPSRFDDSTDVIQNW